MQTLTQLAGALRRYDNIVRITISALRRDAEEGKAIRAEFADELQAALRNACEVLDAARAELSPTTEQSGEAVAEMWAVYFDGEGTRYSSGFVTPWKLYEHQEAAQAEVDSLSDLPGRYMARKVFIYTHPQTAPAVPDRWRDVVRDLVALARVVSIALDDSEERQGDEGRVHLIDSDNFDEVCGALDKLDELPDDKPGYTLGPAGKTEWALRRLLSSTPATAEDSSADQPAAAGPEEWRAAVAELFAIDGSGKMFDATRCIKARETLHAMLAAAPQPVQQLPSALADIAAERRRQVEVEGWTPEHDDQYGEYVLPCAAGCYAMYTLAYPAGDPPRPWPWAGDWWKPSADPRRNLVKSGALIAAAIERIDRAAMPQPNEGRA